MPFQVEILPYIQERINACEDAYRLATPYRYTDPEQWIKILNEFYADEALRRLDRLTQLNKDTEKQKKVLNFMTRRENIVNTMVDWGWTYDPRLAPIGLPTTMPWIPWQQQIDFIEFVYNHYIRGLPWLAEKSRDCGVTWLMCWIYLQEWRWVPGFAGGFGSNKLDNVDKKEDPDCIFEKLRAVLHAMPSWWFPRGFVANKHDKLANLINPEYKCNIAGQGGKEIGRGGRRSIYTVDEKASLEFPEMADHALSQTTNCQGDISTPKGMNHFGQKRWSGKVDVFSFTWKKDFRKDDAWYQHQKKILRREVLAQEVDCDYQASVEGIFIKPEWVRASAEIDLPGIGIPTAGLDVAAGGKNESALAHRTGPKVKVKSWDIDNAVDLVHGVIDICNEVPTEYLHYDAPGVGFAVKSTIERTEREMKFMAYGWEPGGSPSDLFYPEYDKYARDVFTNARGEAWYNLAVRFEKTWEHHTGIRKYPIDELISIDPEDTKLIGELSSVKKIPTTTGKIRAESKEQMMARGVESPDRADAVVLAFLPRDGGYKHVVENYSPIYISNKTFEIDWKSTPKHRALHYGVICLKEDMSINVLCAIWNEVLGHLYIYDELVNDTPEPSKVAPELIKIMKLEDYELHKMIGNEDMFKEGKRSVARELDNEFYRLNHRFQTIKIREPKKYDPYGSMTILNEMVKKRILTIHPKCRETDRQLSTWRLEKGKMKESGMREGLLLIVSELSKNVPLREIMKSKEYFHKIDSSTVRVEKIVEEEVF